MKNFVKKISNIDINYWIYNPEATNTIVLIHGFTGNYEGFQYIVPLLANIRIIIPDLPGFGNSGMPPIENWTIDGLAKIANDFVSSLDLKTPPDILGHSMGGLVVSSMIDQNPNLYNKVILISPVPSAITFPDSRYLGSLLGALQYRLACNLDKTGDKLLKSKTISRVLTKTLLKTKDKERRKEIYQHHFKNLDNISDVEFYRELYHDFNKKGSIDYASTLKTKKILLISGNRDSITPLKYMKNFADAINPDKFIIIKGVGHLIHYEKAPEASEAIREFLSD